MDMNLFAGLFFAAVCCCSCNSGNGVPAGPITDAEISRLYTDMKNNRDSTMLFWRQRCEDKLYGGFLTNFDTWGNDLGTPEKYLDTQCHFIWTFSSLLRRDGNEEYEHLVRTGIDFLLANMWDKKFGGFYWKCRQDGSQLDRTKVVYGEGTAICALSEYYLATKDPRGLEYACQVFDLLQKNCADTRYGGYREYFNEDWTPAPVGGDRKTLDCHIHLMEACTILYEASGQEIHKRKMKELIDLIISRMVDTKRGVGLTQFDWSWNSMPALALGHTRNTKCSEEQSTELAQTTSYGYNSELVWLLNRALTTGNFDAAPYKPIMKKLLDRTVTCGIDWKYGGVYRDGLSKTGEPLVREKEFWQQAEVMIGMLDGYETFGDEDYFKAFANVWDFVRKHMIAKSGEWHTLCDRKGRVLNADTGTPWKAYYHTGRAATECTDRLGRLMK